MKSIRKVTALFLAAICIPFSVFACPSLETIFERTLKKDRQAKELFTPLKGQVFEVGKNLCTAVFVSSTVPRIHSVVTTDKSGRYGMPGPPFDFESGREVNIHERVKNPLPEGIRSALKKHSFEVRSGGGKTLYLWVSPSCRFCQQMAFYFMDRKDLLKKADVSLRVIPAIHRDEDLSAFVCLLQEPQNFLARLAGRDCLNLKGKKCLNHKGKKCFNLKEEKTEQKELRNRIQSADEFAKKTLLSMGVPVVFADDGTLVARGFDPGRVESFLQTLADEK